MLRSASILAPIWLLALVGCSGNSAPPASVTHVKSDAPAQTSTPSASAAGSSSATMPPAADPPPPAPSESKLAPVPTIAPNAKPPSKSVKRGVTCAEDGARCPADQPICVIRPFARCFSEEDIRREMPNAQGLPPISKDTCVDDKVCPDDRPYCIGDVVTGCVDEPTAVEMIRIQEPGPDTYGVYNQCTLAADCPGGKTCCRGFMGHGYSSCQARCDLANTQIQCSTDADCKPLLAFCSDQACRSKIHCNATIMGFVKVCEEVP